MICRAAREKYAKRYRAGANVVLLDPEVAAAFPNSKAVNDALRNIMAPGVQAKRRD
jgi:hypothetical protein